MAKEDKGLARLVPVENTNLHQLAYAQLRHAIMAGMYKPGEALSMRSLASALGTSIMPARDAVLRLVGEQALERAGRGIRIPTLDARRADDVLRLRIAIEGEAAGLAAERATAVQISAIIKAAAKTEKHRRGGNVERFLSANQEFHFAIYRASQSDLVVSMIETLWLQIGPHLAGMASAAIGLDTIDLSPHDDLVAAIKRGDAPAASAALRIDLMAPSGSQGSTGDIGGSSQRQHIA